MVKQELIDATVIAVIATGILSILQVYIKYLINKKQKKDEMEQERDCGTDRDNTGKNV